MKWTKIQCAIRDFSKAYTPKPGKPRFSQYVNGDYVWPKNHDGIDTPVTNAPPEPVENDCYWGIPDEETLPEALPNLRKVSEQFDSDDELFMSYFREFPDDPPAFRLESPGRIDTYRTRLCSPPPSED
jgi:hypothetical protein